MEACLSSRSRRGGLWLVCAKTTAPGAPWEPPRYLKAVASSRCGGGHEARPLPRQSVHGREPWICGIFLADPARVWMVVLPGRAGCPHQKQLVSLSQPGRTFPNGWPHGCPPPSLPRWKLSQTVLGLKPALPKALAKDRSPAGETSCCVWVSCGSHVSPVPLHGCLVAQRLGEECSVYAGEEEGEWGWVEAYSSAICMLGIKGRAQALGRRFRGPPEDGQGSGMSEGSSPDTWSVLGPALCRTACPQCGGGQVQSASD